MLYNLLKFVQLVLGLFVSALLSGCITPTIKDFDNSSNLENADGYLAFVGELVEVEYFNICDEMQADFEASKSAKGEDDTFLICEGVGANMRYKILELVHGVYDRSYVDFKAELHVFSQFFSNKESAVMIYLREYGGRLYDVNSYYDEMSPTTDGRYAYCGDPYFSFYDLDVIKPRPLEDLTFDPPVIKKISDQLPDEKDYERSLPGVFAKAVARVMDFYSEPIFEVNNGYATCKKGVYASEMFRIRHPRL